jgi:hypothetical protein
MADNRIYHPGGTVACTWWLIPLGDITACAAWNLGLHFRICVLLAPKPIMDNA